jgi:hypothetical protein
MEPLQDRLQIASSQLAAALHHRTGTARRDACAHLSSGDRRRRSSCAMQGDVWDVHSLGDYGTLKVYCEENRLQHVTFCEHFTTPLCISPTMTRLIFQVLF